MLTVSKLCIQYVFPQAKKAGVPFALVSPAGVAWLAVLLDEGHIDMRTARASITYMIEHAVETKELLDWVKSGKMTDPFEPDQSAAPTALY